MITIRLLKSRLGDFSQLLNIEEIPDIETTNDLVMVARSIGKLLMPYVTSFKDQSVVEILNDTTKSNWSIADLKSAEYLISKEGYQILVTEESNAPKPTESEVQFIMLDRSSLFASCVPYGDSRTMSAKDAVESQGVIDAVEAILSNTNYFSSNKFGQNPIKSTLTQLKESRKVLGTLNQSAMYKLSSILRKLNRELYAISIV